MITVSINVYKSIKTLQKQLENIKTHLQMPYVVILNCNKFMYDELKKRLWMKIYILIRKLLKRNVFTEHSPKVLYRI